MNLGLSKFYDVQPDSFKSIVARENRLVPFYIAIM